MKKELNVKIGERIRSRREFLSMSREELAEYLGVSSLFIGLIESGNKGMSIVTLIKMCQVLCVSADYILQGIDANNDDYKSILINTIENLQPEYLPLASDMINLLIKTISATNLMHNHQQVEK